MYPVIDLKETGINLRRIMDKRGISAKDVQEYLNLASVQSVYNWCTYIELVYDDGEVIRGWSDYQELITGLLKCGKEELVKIVLESMNEHFLKLRDSDREEIREFYPGKTAEEMFLI